MSRSAFAARVSQLAGEPAVRYVTRGKMHAALMWLKEENAALSEIASRLGYESEAAFGRAFKRFVGISPGAARRPRAAAHRTTLRSCQSGRTCVSIDHHMRSLPDIAWLTPGRGVMPAHGWIFSCLSSIPMNCSIRRARVSAFFAV
jgi:AraC-like DNA-binding protein